MDNETKPDDKIEAASSTASDDKGTESSTVVDDGAKTLADVVKAEFDKSGDSPDPETEEEAEESGSVNEQDPEGEDDSEEDKQDSEEEDAAKGDKPEAKSEPKPEDAKTKKEKDLDSRLDKHPRFVELNEKVKALEVPARFGSEVSNYLRNNNVPIETFDMALGICKLLANDPSAALQKLEAVVTDLRGATGENIPVDLQKRIDEGEMTESVAKEMAKLRATHKMTTQQTETQKQQAHQNAMLSSMQSWLTDKQKTDPDYKPRIGGDTTEAANKFELVEAVFARLCSQTPPANPQQAVALAEKAYSTVNATYKKSLTPAKPAKKVFRAGGQGGGKTNSEPKSLADAIKLAYEG